MKTLLLLLGSIPFVSGQITSIPNSSGSVTSVATGAGLSGGPITGTGTVAMTSNSRTRIIGAGFDGGGSALVAGATAVTYFTVPYGCTISSWNVTVDTGTASFDVWKIASGTAIPTSTNTIVAAAPPTISTGTAANSSTLTGWTTTVTANDIFGVNLSAVSGATKASVTLACLQP